MKQALLLSVAATLSFMPMKGFAGDEPGRSSAEPPLPTVVPQSEGQMKLSFSPVVKKVVPAVVSLYALRLQRQQSPFFGMMGPGFPGFDDLFMRQRIERSLGSATIVDASGLLITNRHVVAGAQQIVVVMHDRREYEAEIVIEEPDYDLAVLKIKSSDGAPYPYLELEDSDRVEVGDLVLAVGNPFGLSHTVTSGIISALGRTHVGFAAAQSYIQTNANINPGNSGGALVSMQGNLMGVCTFIVSKGGGSEGLGFVIPSNTLKPVLTAAKTGQKVVRPWLGADVQTITQAIAETLGLKRPGGVLVTDIQEESPAMKAGLVPGDAILSMDGEIPADDEAFQARINTAMVGTVIDLEVLKKQGERKHISLALSGPPEVVESKMVTLKNPQNPLAGATFAEPTPGVRAHLKLSGKVTGMVAYKIAPGSSAEGFGLLPGDQIVKVNGMPITSLEKFKRLMEQKTSTWQLELKRGEQTINFSLVR